MIRCYSCEWMHLCHAFPNIECHYKKIDIHNRFKGEFGINGSKK